MERLLDLIKINNAIANTLDYDDVLRLVVEKAADLTGADWCLLLLDNGSGTFRTAAWVGLPASAAQDLAIEPGAEPETWLREQLRCRAGDLLAWTEIVHQGQPLGGLAISHAESQEGAASARPEWLDDRLLLAALADQAAIALEHAGRLRRAEEAARVASAAQARFQTLLELSPDAMIILDRTGRIELVNAQAENVFGYSRAELLGQSVELLIPPRLRVRHAAHHQEYFRAPTLRPMGGQADLFALRRDGTEFPVEVSLSPLEENGDFTVISTLRDITPRRHAEQERLELLRREQQKSEQLVLAVREAHHRIKNNLQAVTDFLALELGAAEDLPSSRLLRECMSRIQAIAMVHDLLSHEDAVQWVDTRTVAERLVSMAVESNRSPFTRIDLDLRVAPVLLPSKHATTIALILNELVSNAAKHAFSERPRGELQVSLGEVMDGLLLRVQDDGPGLPPGFDLATHANVGLRIVQALTEADLGGWITFSNAGGLQADVWFPVPLESSSGKGVDA